MFWIFQGFWTSQQEHKQLIPLRSSPGPWSFCPGSSLQSVSSLSSRCPIRVKWSLLIMEFQVEVYIGGMKMVLLVDKAGCFSWFPGLYSALGRLKKCVIEREMTRISDYPPWVFRLGSEMKSQVWSQALRSNTFRGDWQGCKWLPQLWHDVWSKACYLVTRFLMRCKCGHAVCL